MIYADILAQNTLLEFKDASKICNYSGGRFCFPLRKRGIEGESEARGVMFVHTASLRSP